VLTDKVCFDLFILQHYVSMFIATLTIPVLLAPAMCMDEDNVGKSEIIGTLFVASGIITLLQTTVGIRSVKRDVFCFHPILL
jgi:xanthine/uracil permease